MVGMTGCTSFAFALLGDPNASHFGTRLRTARLKAVINRFYNGSRLLEVRILTIKKEGNSALLVIHATICYNKLKVNEGGKRYGNERYHS